MRDRLSQPRRSSVAPFRPSGLERGATTALSTIGLASGALPSRYLVHASLISTGTFSAYNPLGQPAPSRRRSPSAKVLLFSTSTCSWCRRAKRYFKERGVPFKEINIERDTEASRDIVRMTGQRGVPVIKIGNSWIVGFDKDRVEKELARRAS